MSLNTTNTPWLNRNENWFDKRQARGTADGSLTTAESEIVTSELAQLQADQAAARADGSVSPQERKQLWQEASQVNRSIFDLRHNNLGEMGPGGANAQQPHLITPNHPHHPRPVRA